MENQAGKANFTSGHIGTIQNKPMGELEGLARKLDQAIDRLVNANGSLSNTANVLLGPEPTSLDKTAEVPAPHAKIEYIRRRLDILHDIAGEIEGRAARLSTLA